MSADTHPLQKPVEKMANLEGFEENLRRKAYQLRTAYVAKLLRRLEQ
jgi:hypothetical protein